MNFQNREIGCRSVFSNFAFAKAAGVPDWELQQLQSSSPMHKLSEWSGMFVVKRSTCRNKSVPTRSLLLGCKAAFFSNEISHQQTDVANQCAVKLTSADNWTVRQLWDMVQLPVSQHVVIISVYVNSSAVSRICFLTRGAVAEEGPMTGRGGWWGSRRVTAMRFIFEAIMQIWMNVKFLNKNLRKPV